MKSRLIIGKISLKTYTVIAVYSEPVGATKIVH
jgi:hypothetical protein